MTYKQRMISQWIQLAFLFTLFHTVHCYSTRILKRTSASDIEENRGAILVKNGIPTSCECAIIDNKAAMVAANCLDFNNGSFNADTQYEIYFDNGNGQSPAKVSVKSDHIIIHPSYNTDTFANNLAILQFDFTEQGSSWSSNIASYRQEWSDVAYVRRNLANADSMEWDSPKVETYSDIDQGCDKASTLYSKNTDTFYCSLIHTPSLSNSNCNMPYGSIYGVVSGDTAIAGLYSHSVVYGDDTCSGDKQYHYYTVLTYYLKYARSVLGRTPKELCEDKEGLSNFKRIINYRMKWNSSANDDGTSMFGGDMLAIQPRAAVSSSDSTSASSTIMDDNDNNSRSNDIGDNSSNTSKDNDRTRNAGDDNSTVDGTDDDRTRNADDDNSTSDGADTGTDNFQTGELHHDGNDGNSKDSDNSDIEANHSDRDSSYAGPSKGAVIAMGVTIPLVVIGLAVLAYVLFRKHRKKYPLGKWRKGTIKRKSTVRALIEEIGGASRPEVLPTYSAIYDLHTLASDQQHVSEQPPSR